MKLNLCQTEIMEQKITTELLQKILEALAVRLEGSSKKVTLLVGGAGALVGCYNYKEKTTDVDALPLGSSLDEISVELKQIADDFQLPADWLNPHFSTFTLYLPSDYKKRCRRFFEAPALAVDALGPEDLMIMKLMAGRTKDQSHIRFLMKQKPLDLSVVENRLNELVALFPREAKKALDLFDDIQEDMP